MLYQKLYEFTIIIKMFLRIVSKKSLGLSMHTIKMKQQKYSMMN